MGSRRKPGKKLVVVRGDVLAKIAHIANREGKTITAFTNEVLEQAIRAYGMKLSLSDAVELYTLMKIVREGGVSMVPREILRYLILKAYKSHRDELAAMFQEAGSWFGRYILARVRDRDPLDFVKQLLHVSIWDAREIHVNRDGGRLTVRCVAPQLSTEETELLAAYIEGLISALEFKPVGNDVIRGIILLEFEGGGGIGEAHGEGGSSIREG